MKPELIEVVKKLKKFDNEMQIFIDSVPRSIGSAFFDNDYAEAQGQQRDILIQALFGENAEDIFWFIFEWKPGNNKPQLWEADGTAWVFETEDDYYRYLEKL